MSKASLIACAAPELCPACGEGEAHLFEVGGEGNPTLLAHLGLEIRRPVARRFRRCDHCHMEYAGAAEMDFSGEQMTRAYADVGSVRFPLPSDLEEKSFLQYCSERLRPEVLAQSPRIENSPEGWRWKKAP